MFVFVFLYQEKKIYLETMRVVVGERLENKIKQSHANISFKWKNSQLH